MKSQSTYIIIGLLVVAALAFGGYILLNNDADEDSDAIGTEDEQMVDTAEPFAGITHVDMKQFYEGGQHTFAGELMMPTACDLLETEVEVRESMPEQIHITFSVINTAEVCAQVMTPQRFMVSVQASEEAEVSAELMGYRLEVNLHEPEPGETPEDFELFIKG